MINRSFYLWLLFLTFFISFTGSCFESEKEQISIYIVKNEQKKILSPYGMFSYLIWSQLATNVELNKKYDFKLEEINGSVSTLFEIEKRKNELFLGIVQSDVLYHFINGGHINFPKGRKTSNIRAIVKLFDEDIVLKKNTDLNFSNLNGAKINLGEIGTGTYASASNVLKLLGISYFECFGDTICDFEFKVESRKNGNYNFCQSNSSKKCEFLFKKRETQIIAGSIPNVYKNKPIKEHANILTVQAILIGAAQLPDEIVSFLKVTFKKLKNLKNLKNIENNKSTYPNNIDELDQKVSFDDLGGALLYSSSFISSSKIKSPYIELPITPHKAISINNLPYLSKLIVNYIPLSIFQYTLAIILIFYLLLSFYTHLQATGHSFNEFNNFETRDYFFKLSKYLFYFVFFHLVIAFGIYLGEHHHSNFLERSNVANKGIYEAFTWVGYLVFTGSIKSPIYSASATIWVGVLQGGYVLITTMFSLTLGKRIKRIMDKPIAKSVFIVGKSRLQLDVEHELKGVKMASYTISSSEFWNILSKDESLGAIDENIVNCFSRDGKHKEYTIKKIRETAQAFIVMSDSAALSSTGMKDADLMSLKLTEFIIREFITSGSEARLTVEVDDPFNVSIFESLATSNHCEEKFEAICVDRFGAELLVQSIKKPFIVNIFEELLKTKNSDNEIYFDQRKEIDGKLFKELFEFYEDINHLDSSIPIGIIRGDGTYELNPAGNRVLDIENDQVILISRNQPT